MQPVEEGPEEVLEDQANQQQMQDELIEKLADYSEELQGTQDLCTVHGPWRKKKDSTSTDRGRSQ